MGKTVFITGGSSGIGLAVIHTLKDDGWNIISPSHKELDLSNLNEVELYLNNVEKIVNNLDAFIHIAGVWHDEEEAFAGKSLSKFDTKQIIDTINVTLTSVMVLLSKILPRIKSGTVVAISGTFADGAEGWLPYYVSKRALEDFIVGLSQDTTNCNVFGISPADTATLAYKKFYAQYYSEAQSPDNIANIVKDLVDNRSKYKSGDIIEVREGTDKLGYHV